MFFYICTMQTILKGDKARAKVLEGMNIVNDVVKVTLGPKGRNVMMNVIHGQARSTKDGVSCAREVSPDDPLLATGAKVIREAAQKTADEAGDNTTTTTILAAEICNNLNKLLLKGHSPVKLKQGLEMAKERCTAWIKDNAQPIAGDIERIRQIATISANNNDQIGDLIAQAFSKIGADGVIKLEENYSDKCEVEIVPGYSFNRGMISPYFITDEAKSNCVLDNSFVLLYDKKISKVVDIITPLTYAMQQQKPLLIICAGMEGEALGTLVANKVQKGLQVCVCIAPEQGMKRAEIMEDMAIFTGGMVISEDKGTSLDKDNFKPEFLGRAGMVIAERDKTRIISGDGDKANVITRQATIKNKLSEASSDNEKEYLRYRAASIGDGAAILRIGASTNIEKGDILDLAEDAILAVRSAIEEGYLPGGGLSLLRCSQFLSISAASAGEKLVYDALRKPLEQILLNNGMKGLTLFQNGLKWLTKGPYIDSVDYTVERISKSSFDFGYNAKTGSFSNLREDGVIDAAKVVRCAIENGISVSIMFLLTEILISEMPN